MNEKRNVYRGGLFLKAPLHVNILAIFIALFVLLAGTLIWYNYHRNSQLALDAADTLLQTVNEKVLERTRNFISPPVALVELGATLPGLQSWGAGYHKATAYFLDALDTFPQLYGLYIGYGNGGFFQAVNFHDVDAATMKRLKAPPGAHYGIRKIRRVSAERRVQTWTFLDAARKPLGPDIVTDASYDPRVRPWYRSAIGQDRASMTDAYIFASLKAPGITVSRQMASDTEAVLAADITLSRLSSFVRDQKVGKSGVVFIHNEQGELIAFPDADRTMKTVMVDGKPKLRPVMVTELGIPALAEAVRRTANTDRKRALFTVAGREYIASVAPLTDSFGSDKRVTIVVPVDDFLGPIAEHRTRSLLFSLIPLLLAVPLIVWISRLISRPIGAIADETARIRALSFEDSPRVISRITEIRQLANSVAAMKRTIHTFTQYVPKALVEQLIRSGNVQGRDGDRRELTIMFTDVANFTDMAEDMSPEDLMRKTSGYFRAMGEIILANKGSIDKYIGDAIMAFWNAPLDDPDHVANACRTMLLCRARSRELDAEWRAAGEATMHTRFGLHTGDTVVGNIGSPDRMDYTALGASVNLASRLEGLNKQYGTELLVSETVCHASRDLFLFRPVDTTTVKGISRPVSVFELCAAHHGPEAITATRAQRVFCDHWKEIYERIQRDDWETAYPLIRRFINDYPEDRVAKLYAERCRRHMRQSKAKPVAAERASADP